MVPERRFQQERVETWDHLSPFLFNIVVEWLSVILNKAASKGFILGENFGVTGVQVSHLQFANDTFVFLKPRTDYPINLKRILRYFELSSGPKINFHKSCIVKVGRSQGNEVYWVGLFKCRDASFSINYLGLPLGSNHGTKAFWNLVIAKIESRLAPWKKKFLSKGGRLVLIKSVLSSIPTYYMSVFRMPVGVAQKIEKLQRSFLWGDGTEKRKLHAVDWTTVCKSKKKGGLGISRMLDKNFGLLFKWVWRFGHDGSSLWKKVVCAKYGVEEKRLLWDWQSLSVASFFVIAVANVIKGGSRSTTVFLKGVKVVVGNGYNVRLWQDVMIEGHSLNEAFPRIHVLAIEKSGFLSDFGQWQDQKWVWLDTIAWDLNPSVLFSVASFLRALVELNGNVSWMDRVPWRGICRLKVEIFIWQLLRGRVLVGDVLKSFGMRVYLDYLIRFRLAWWFKHHGKGSNETLTAILLNIKDLCVDPKPVQKYRNVNWIPPLNGDLKFNVDGFALGKPGPAVIGGV
ncbi:hypothetical protein Dsin_004472 [Dipteronia sinensis]|uniref:Uncharacterized protein n=1 Tax=Dipteronia sinensis TaxID=43782 RepID=A0AAE0AVP0_9ROSI|nr:hypothetical protein Dsin_004472 [Dipteronia sinensis]